MKHKLWEIATGKYGDSKYTDKYMEQNIGKFPVFSSSTQNNGLAGKINHYDFDANELSNDNIMISWTKDGEYAGTLFARSGKFNLTGHAGLIVINENWKSNLNSKYLLWYLNVYHIRNVQKRALGIIKSVKWIDIENCEIQIPDIKSQAKIISIISPFEELIKSKKEIDTQLLEKVKELKTLMLLKLLN